MTTEKFKKAWDLKCEIETLEYHSKTFERKLNDLKKKI